MIGHMNRKVFYLIGLSLLFLSACGNSGKQKSVDQAKNTGWASYAVYGMDRSSGFYMSRFTIPTDGRTDLVDIVEPTKFCPPSVPYICAYGRVFIFAVPKRDLHVGDQWKFAGRTYQLIPAYMRSIPGGRVPGSERPDWYMKVLGDEEHPYIIEEDMEKNPHHCRNVFMFSSEKGLIGQSLSCDDFSSTNLLEGTYGYGSKEFNAQIDPAAYLTESEALKLFDKPE